jgi:DNA-binding GntR family transcriptional regulator
MTETTEQKAYDHLRRKLALGVLAPGARVSAVATAREIGVSPTPVTQAIRRLEIEGLIDLVPHFGTFVKKPDLRDIEHLYDLRLALETHAVAKAAGRLSATDLAELEETCRTMEECQAECQRLAPARPVKPETLRRASLADLQFHTIIVRASSNPRIIKLMEDSHVLMRGMALFPKNPAAYWTENLRSTATGHREVYEAIRRGDRKAARKSLGTHLRESIKSVRAQYRATAGTSPEAAGASSVYNLLRQNVESEPADDRTSRRRSPHIRKPRGERS